jgi:hypothetical protein
MIPSEVHVTQITGITDNAISFESLTSHQPLIDLINTHGQAGRATAYSL